MKKLKYIAAAAICALSMTSCDDFLQEDARGTQSLDTYFETVEQCEAYAAGCYNNITFYGWWQIENAWMVFESASDDLWAGNTNQACDFYNVTEYRPNMAENGELANFWQYRYKGIMNCNVGIARIAEANIDEAVRNRILSEVRFLRAYFYFDLVKNYGGVPLITTFAMPDELEGITRTPAKDVYEWIEGELIEAAKYLPKRSQYSANDLGRVTQGAAYALLAKCYLYNENWNECKKYCEQVINSGEYELLPNYGDVWSCQFNNSKESIFEVQNIYDQVNSLGSSLSTVTYIRGSIGDGWAWFQPTSDLENAFLAQGDTERLRWSIIKCGDTEIAGEDSFDEFVEFNKTGYDETLLAQWEETYNIDPTKCVIIRPDYHKSARVIRKFYIPLNDRPDKFDISLNPLNLRIIRYADVLLMHAEACNELGSDGEARTSLNKVRNRVGLDNVITSGDELRQAIRAERRLELCFEGNRIYDIRRWKDKSGKPVISSIMGPNGSFVKYNRAMIDPFEANNQIESSKDKGAGFDENIHLVFPIPLYEVQHSNGSIEQNPGY